MGRRSGSADLPLHGGRVPIWLADRMTRLGAVIAEAIIHHYGRDEFLRRLAHPFWFQSFGAVMGMDWHSSGITTSVIGALKRGLAPLAGELGLHVCGGRGRHSRQDAATSLSRSATASGFDGAALAKASRLVAKVDSAAVQDGFDLYLHGFIVADDGKWVVVQQGMNGERRQARRYHWLSEGLTSFVDAPHAAIDGTRSGRDRQPDRPARRRLAARPDRYAERLGPDGDRARDARMAAPEGKPADPAPPEQPFAAASRHAGASRRALRATCMTRRLHGNLAAAADRGPERFRRAAAGPRRRRAHRARARHGRRGRAWRALSLQPIPRGSRSPMAARTGIPFRCRSRSTTRPSPC